MPQYTVHFTQHHQITVEADDQQEAEDIATGTPLEYWTESGETMTSEEASWAY